jgi:hypothetical protein
MRACGTQLVGLLELILAAEAEVAPSGSVPPLTAVAAGQGAARPSSSAGSAGSAGARSGKVTVPAGLAHAAVCSGCRPLSLYATPDEVVAATAVTAKGLGTRRAEALKARAEARVALARREGDKQCLAVGALRAWEGGGASAASRWRSREGVL